MSHTNEQLNTKPTWDFESVNQLFEKPFVELIYQAAQVHRVHFNPNEVQISTLLSIKTGSCPEDCAYCPQSAHYNTGLERERLLGTAEVVKSAQAAKDKGATRFCMGAAWRSPPREKQFAQVIDMVKAVKALGMETCMTLGMLEEDQAHRLKDAGLDYYNHNLDTSPDFYEKIITTRTYQDRLDTLDNVRKSGMKACCGGIIGMGEAREDRINFLLALAHLPTPPESVPINKLVQIPGTPLENTQEIDSFEFVRTIAVARIMMPTSFVRLSAGRTSMNKETQALAFLAGANSIFYGETLLTAENNLPNEDDLLFKELGLEQLPLESLNNSHDTQHASCKEAAATA